MKAAEPRSTHSQHHEAAGHTAAFFDQARESSQDATAPAIAPPFFAAPAPTLQRQPQPESAPFFQPAPARLQRQPAFESEGEGAAEDTLQRKPAFESSEEAIQTQLLDRPSGAIAANPSPVSPANAAALPSPTSSQPVHTPTPAAAHTTAPPPTPALQTSPEPRLDTEPEAVGIGKTGAIASAAASSDDDPSDDSSPTPPENRVQAKLIIGNVGDRHEREADAMADLVVSTPSPHPAELDSSPAPPTLQKQAVTNQDNEVQDPQIEQILASTKTSGTPLDATALQEMESKFGASFTHVRIHTDRTAQDLAARLNAQAFTHGTHIYFNAGKYDPTTPAGKHLLAHELTHVLQQNGRVHRYPIQRTNGSPPSRLEVTQRGPYRGTWLDTAASPRHLHIPLVSIPDIKRRHRSLYGNPSLYEGSKKLTVRRGARDTDQRNLWLTQPQISTVAETQLSEKVSEATNRGGVNTAGVYFFKARRNESFMVFSQRNPLLEIFKIPTWDNQGQFRRFQVDHAVENQLGGVDTIDNYELLDASSNASSGSRLNNQIDTRITEALSALGREHPGTSLPSPSEARRNYEVQFENFDFSLPTTGGTGDHLYWTLRNIGRGDHTRIIQALTAREVERLGNASNENLFTGPTGGTVLPIPDAPTPQWLTQVDFVSWEASSPDVEAGAVTGTLNVNLFTRHTPPRRYPIAGDSETHQIVVRKIPGLAGGYLDLASSEGFTRGMRRILRFQGLSPVEIDEASVLGRGGLMIRGRILPTVPFIQDANIELLVIGDEVQVRKTFDIGEIHVPPPFQLKNTSLTVFYSSSRGLGIEGETNFEIQQVGEGRIGAAASTRGGFELEGEFNFDSELFDPAQVQVTYRDNTFGVTGTIGIPRGKVRGIKSATITASYSEGTFTANGEAELDIRGVERGSLAVSYSDAGWSIGGTFNLSNEIPGIRSGSISATVSKVAGEEGYQLSARGTAVPDLPGIDSELTVEYDNGAINIHARASYARDLLSGTIEVGATNRALDGEGQPTGEPTDTFIVYGGGSLTVRITPWLQGTVGVRFEPNGEIVVSGRIGLPGAINVFDRIGIPDRELFGIGFDIPIFAIPVGPRSIGLVASIRGGLKAHAGIGPGRLEDLGLGIEYNPAHPDETHVTGSGRFVIPAEAGLALFVRATIGLSAVVGGVEGGLELSGGLGLEAAAEADITVDWTPRTGLELRANLGAYVQPKFVFTIDGLIRAWFAWYEKEWRWRLADYEYGPDFRFGVRLPIHYRQGEPFNISFDDLQLTYPRIEASSFIGGLVRDIRSRRQ